MISGDKKGAGGRGVVGGEEIFVFQYPYLILSLFFSKSEKSLLWTKCLYSVIRGRLSSRLEEGRTTHSSILAWGIPMDRGAWWATVHEVTKSQTRLSD